MSMLLNNQVQYTAEKEVLFCPLPLKGALFIKCVKFSNFRHYKIIK